MCASASSYTTSPFSSQGGNSTSHPSSRHSSPHPPNASLRMSHAALGSTPSSNSAQPLNLPPLAIATAWSRCLKIDAVSAAAFASAVASASQDRAGVGRVAILPYCSAVRVVKSYPATGRVRLSEPRTSDVRRDAGASDSSSHSSRSEVNGGVVNVKLPPTRGDCAVALALAVLERCAARYGVVPLRNTLEAEVSPHYLLDEASDGEGVGSAGGAAVTTFSVVGGGLEGVRDSDGGGVGLAPEVVSLAVLWGQRQLIGVVHTPYSPPRGGGDVDPFDLVRGGPFGTLSPHGWVSLLLPAVVGASVTIAQCGRMLVESVQSPRGRGSVAGLGSVGGGVRSVGSLRDGSGLSPHHHTTLPTSEEAALYAATLGACAVVKCMMTSLGDLVVATATRFEKQIERVSGQLEGVLLGDNVDVGGGGHGEREGDHEVDPSLSGSGSEVVDLSAVNALCDLLVDARGVIALVAKALSVGVGCVSAVLSGVLQWRRVWEMLSRSRLDSKEPLEASSPEGGGGGGGGGGVSPPSTAPSLLISDSSFLSSLIGVVNDAVLCVGTLVGDQLAPLRSMLQAFCEDVVVPFKASGTADEGQDEVREGQGLYRSSSPPQPFASTTQGRVLRALALCHTSLSRLQAVEVQAQCVTAVFDTESSALALVDCGQKGMEVGRMVEALGGAGGDVVSAQRATLRAIEEALCLGVPSWVPIGGLAGALPPDGASGGGRGMGVGMGRQVGRADTRSEGEAGVLSDVALAHSTTTPTAWVEDAVVALVRFSDAYPLRGANVAVSLAEAGRLDDAVCLLKRCVRSVSATYNTHVGATSPAEEVEASVSEGSAESDDEAAITSPRHPQDPLWTASRVVITATRALIHLPTAASAACGGRHSVSSEGEKGTDEVSVGEWASCLLSSLTDSLTYIATIASASVRDGAADARALQVVCVGSESVYSSAVAVGVCVARLGEGRSALRGISTSSDSPAPLCFGTESELQGVVDASLSVLSALSPLVGNAARGIHQHAGILLYASSSPSPPASHDGESVDASRGVRRGHNTAAHTPLPPPSVPTFAARRLVRVQASALRLVRSCGLLLSFVCAPGGVVRGNGGKGASTPLSMYTKGRPHSTLSGMLGRQAHRVHNVGALSSLEDSHYVKEDQLTGGDTLTGGVGGGGAQRAPWMSDGTASGGGDVSVGFDSLSQETTFKDDGAQMHPRSAVSSIRSGVEDSTNTAAATALASVWHGVRVGVEVVNDIDAVLVHGSMSPTKGTPPSLSVVGRPPEGSGCDDVVTKMLASGVVQRVEASAIAALCSRVPPPTHTVEWVVESDPTAPLRDGGHHSLRQHSGSEPSDSGWRVRTFRPLPPALPLSSSPFTPQSAESLSAHIVGSLTATWASQLCATHTAASLFLQRHSVGMAIKSTPPIVARRARTTVVVGMVPFDDVLSTRTSFRASQIARAAARAFVSTDRHRVRGTPQPLHELRKRPTVVEVPTGCLSPLPSTFERALDSTTLSSPKPQSRLPLSVGGVTVAHRSGPQISFIPSTPPSSPPSAVSATQSSTPPRFGGEHDYADRHFVATMRAFSGEVMEVGPVV